MAQFAENTWFEVITCGGCSLQFAMTHEFYKQRRDKKDSFWCPAGCERVFTGKSEAERLKDQLAEQQRSLDAAREKAALAESERSKISRAHVKMRKRVMNGVCPCCNRTFQNLMGHMKTEHADFLADTTLLGIRKLFGMTQSDVAREIGVDQMSVSLFERNKPLQKNKRESIEWWLERQMAKV